MEMPRTFVVLSVLGGLLLAGPAEATIRKCSSNAQSTAPITDRVMGMLDGKVIGEWPSVQRGPTSASATFDAVRTEDIWTIEIECLEYATGGGALQGPVVSMITKEGAAGVARRYLSELAALQEAYHRKHGRYTESAHDLKFFVRRTAALPLKIMTTDSGWTASIRAAREICFVEGRARPGRTFLFRTGRQFRPGRAAGEIRCVAEAN